MTAEWLHLPPPYPPGVGPLCGAELEAWYEDLQDILGSDGGGAKLARAPPCSEEPEFLDVLESCSLTWLTDGVGVGVGGEAWGGVEGVQRVTIPEEPPTHPPHHTSSCLSPAEAQGDRERGSDGERGGSGGGDLLPPEFFELLSEGGVGVVETAGIMVSGSYHHHQLHHHSNNVQQPESPSASEEEHPCVPDSPSCSSSASPPSSPTSTAFSSSQQDKRKRGNSLSFPSSGSRSSSSSSSAKKSRREKEQEKERKVQELTDQNERLKAEIDRLGEEVQRTRRALIERLVNTRKS
ncbi:DNA damage-inducible transcript 3 protein isoform X4 [Coregonus clupeaformis]|uniref:DNA damage-inducible transcript 3 protein isoform X4 n=1 Tax=Coregonus clupeaformis TaxID=59861 RepID=UPI001E1C4670|nr:DNA damage-inducible transcript 3 protein isoform X4 [Coregonus clupeaformis]